MSDKVLSSGDRMHRPSNKDRNTPYTNGTFVSRRFSKESISGQTKVKASVQRGIMSKILEQFPAIEPYVEDILPKKVGIVQVKWFVLPCLDSSSFLV